MRIQLSLWFIAIALCTYGCRSKQIVYVKTSGNNTLSAADNALGWELLFDGSSLDGWRNYKSQDIKGWEVRGEDMVALGNSPSRDIITRDTFSNFELSLEWNIATGGNSGIFYNVREEEHLAGLPDSGPEYQLIDDIGYPGDLEDWQTTGANYAMHPPKVKVSHPAGTYNHSRVIVDNGVVQHWLNDRLVVSYKLWTEDWKERVKKGKWKDFPDYGIYPSGHIGLQDHGNEIRFRNIKIRRL